MSHFISAFITGVVSGIVASIITLLFLNRIKPKILISNQIAKSINSKGKTIYKIKIINRTRRPIMNAKAQLYLMTPTAIPGGFTMTSREIPLKISEIMELSKFDLKDETAGYDLKFVSYKNIERSWKDDAHSFLRFRIHAIHSLSGFGKVFYQKYHTKKSHIKEGDFEFGNSLEIK